MNRRARLWPRARPPFTGLRPGLHHAGQLLNQPGGAAPPGWQQLRVGITTHDTDRCTTALNEILARTGAHWALTGSDVDLGLTVLGAGGQWPGEAWAAHALAVVVDAGGWGRATRCTTTDCVMVIIDTTNGASRTRCDHHTRHRHRQHE